MFTSLGVGRLAPLPLLSFLFALFPSVFEILTILLRLFETDGILSCRPIYFLLFFTPSSIYHSLAILGDPVGNLPGLMESLSIALLLLCRLGSPFIMCYSVQIL